MTARMRRLISDYEQVKKDFTGHRNIIVTPLGEEPPERYHVTYFVNGIYLAPDGSVLMLGRHEVEITLHTEYPKIRPVCRIFTPIWHPNFRDGQICIGDIWGAGESLSDIIVNIGDMIQYKSWNSFSPLSAEAAQWAMENKHLFPVGTLDLHRADYSATKQNVDIDLFSAGEAQAPEASHVNAADAYDHAPNDDFQAENDFEITAEELSDIEFIPSVQRMQNVSHGGLTKGKKVNFKTVLVKGILWAIIGSLLGFGVTEALNEQTDGNTILRAQGHEDIAEYNELYVEINGMYAELYNKYPDVNFENLENVDSDTLNAIMNDYTPIAERENELTGLFIGLVDKYGDTEKYGTALATDDVEGLSESTSEAVGVIQDSASRLSSAIWSALIALFIGLFLGLGEGVYYGSKGKTVRYMLIGAGLSIVIGFISGYIAQVLYSDLLDLEASMFVSSLVRALGWSVMGIGVGAAIGLIKPDKRRVRLCIVGGFAGAAIGGFVFNYISDAVSTGATDTGIVSRGIGIVIMGLLVGLGIGLLEQFAKTAWLKVVRGEFEGKEYLVFGGVTSIGNNGRNTIVLFKDKLVGPNHCDIVLEGNRYMLIDKGTSMGTVVNGRRVEKHVLRRGDAIAIGNSVLVFNTK